MSIEELRKYKQELLARKSSPDSYFICEDYNEVFDGVGKPSGLFITKDEIIRVEDTENTVKRCEELLAKYTKILDENARMLDYYIKSRLALEKIYKETEMRSKRWENYRLLWYKYFENEQMPNNTFGQLEKINRR